MDNKSFLVDGVKMSLEETMEYIANLPDDEEDFLTGKTCNPDAPEECESCQ